MKIAISSTGKELTSEVDPRFGRSSYLCVFDTTSNEIVEVIDNTEGKNASQGAGINVAGLVASKDVQAILTGRVGPKAMAVVDKANIKVVSGVQGTVEQAVAQFNEGKPLNDTKTNDTKNGAPLNCQQRQRRGQGKGQGQGKGLGRRQGQNCQR